MRQSMSWPKACNLPCLSKKLMIKNDNVVIATTQKTASDTKGRRKKKLLNPPSTYATASAPMKMRSASQSVEP